MDNIGKAGFDYDFATLEGNHCEMADAYNALDIAAHAGLTLVIAVLANIFPILQELPTKKFKLVKAVHDQMEGVARRLIEREGKNKELVDHNSKDRSIIGVLSKRHRLWYRVALTTFPHLVNSERSKGTFNLTKEEVVNQVRCSASLLLYFCVETGFLRRSSS